MRIILPLKLRSLFLEKILIVEDDHDISSGIAEFLENFGYQLDFAYNGQHGLSLLAEESYDLVLLDINLPGINGIEICRSLSKGELSRIPVIMMTANEQMETKLDGFDAGAWDYLIKPFSFKELLARIRVALMSANSMSEASEKLNFAGITLDKSKSTLIIEGQKLPIYATGIALMEELIKAAPDIVSRKKLCYAVWQDEMPDSDPLRAHIYKLRKLLEKHGYSIQSIKGLGYSLLNQAS